MTEVSEQPAGSPGGTMKSGERTMPSDFSIAVRPGAGATLGGVNYGGERRQSMEGFEDTYTDIVDYIVRITHRIWEDQDIGYIYDTYAPGCRLYDDSGVKFGVERLIDGTTQSINAFPDCRHYADDVIWAGSDTEGFVTSHRAINIGHHTGPWRWGPPTGRKLETWVMANCVVWQNEIYEEWVLYNTAAKLQQLGIDVAEAARTYAREGGLVPVSERPSSEALRLVGGRKPVALPEPDNGAGFDVEGTVRALWHNIYNRRDLSAVDRVYAENVRWHGTTNRTGYGRSDVRAMARGLLATFPDLGVQVDEVYWMGNDTDGYSISVRWSGAGTHRGFGLYGKPTGRRAHLWGMSQLYVMHGRIVEEWSLFNEFDVIAQLVSEDGGPELV
ncbi:ester cyclase [Saccharopolyspora mangrovi]|uniref:Ester cyclase n=1 Tax=Saccharopolyspora mangrovi TaxID=3082379 RepID=A0ABU6A6U2_9PSEU|nr:ester cyclase [Saccharopolyspora sp. S2-29]MEB3367241.1 ester cyclase [Saccharopolyspora sp. S2-29]